MNKKKRKKVASHYSLHYSAGKPLLFHLYVLLFFLVCAFAECVQQAVSQESAALRAELDEERRKYQGLLREFTRLEQRYDNLREMSLLTEVQNTSTDTL